LLLLGLPDSLLPYDLPPPFVFLPDAKALAGGDTKGDKPACRLAGIQYSSRLVAKVL